MKWIREYLPEARNDLRRLDGSTKQRVIKMLQRVSQNPLPANEGGYGKPLGKHKGIDLTGMMKVKLRSEGIRVVYKLERREGRMVVVVVGVRTHQEAYRAAYERRLLHGL